MISADHQPVKTHQRQYFGEDRAGQRQPEADLDFARKKPLIENDCAEG
ncbi:hypothetical protein [Leisingera sp. M658]|nr:hypothetical protein [Leisingera sp. M658]UWQ77070.1 hypothetical protein K3724_21540 [Leisingera sp. M658]